MGRDDTGVKSYNRRGLLSDFEVECGLLVENRRCWNMEDFQTRVHMEKTRVEGIWLDFWICQTVYCDPCILKIKIGKCNTLDERSVIGWLKYSKWTTIFGFRLSAWLPRWSSQLGKKIIFSCSNLHFNRLRLVMKILFLGDWWSKKESKYDCRKETLADSLILTSCLINSNWLTSSGSSSN